MAIEWKIIHNEGYYVQVMDSVRPCCVGIGKTPEQAMEQLIERLAFDAAYQEDLLKELKNAKLRTRGDIWKVPAPDWSQAPEGAKFFAVDANGKGFWYRSPPVVVQDFWRHPRTSDVDNAGDFILPLGIDWRLTLQEKPEGE